MTTLITNTHIISPDVEIENGAIEISDGKIVAVHEAGSNLPAADTTFDAQGQYAFPGFVDIHAHGADTKDVCDGSLDSIRHIAQKKLAEGVTTWLPTTLTQPQDKLESIAAICAEYMANQEFCKTPGLHVEGPFINRDKAGAQNPEFVREPNLDELKAIHEICKALVVSIAPEMPNACAVIKGAKDLGITSSAAHSNATYPEMMAAKEAGLTHLTHFGNAMTGLHHREIGMVGTGLYDNDVLIELICDKVHLCPEMVQLCFATKPIEKIIMITDSMCASWIGEGEVQLGGLDVVVEDNIARLKEGGALAGSTLRFDEGVRNVAELTDLPLHQIVKATSLNAALSIGLENIGKIEAGYCADIAILDKDFNSTQTFVDGVAKM